MDMENLGWYLAVVAGIIGITIFQVVEEVEDSDLKERIVTVCSAESESAEERIRCIELFKENL